MGGKVSVRRGSGWEGEHAPANKKWIVISLHKLKALQDVALGL